MLFQENGLVFQFRYVLQQRRKCLLASHKLVNHLLHVRVSCAGSHHDEGLFNLFVLCHQMLHLLLIQLRPNFLN